MRSFFPRTCILQTRTYFFFIPLQVTDCHISWTRSGRKTWQYVWTKLCLHHSLKGNEASPRQGNMERKSKLKKKIKIPLFPASQTTFWKCRKCAKWWRTECFWRNQRSKQLIEVLKCVYDVTNSEALSAHNFWLKHIQKVKYTLYC